MGGKPGLKRRARKIPQGVLPVDAEGPFRLLLLLRSLPATPHFLIFNRPLRFRALLLDTLPFSLSLSLLLSSSVRLLRATSSAREYSLASHTGKRVIFREVQKFFQFRASWGKWGCSRRWWCVCSYRAILLFVPSSRMERNWFSFVIFKGRDI